MVSIVICTYNHAHYLNRVLASAQRLTYQSLEIVVVDNNSTDTTAEIATKYNVKYVLETTQGLSHARNRGILESSGEYIAFVDDDIVFANSHWVENMLSGFALADNVGVVGGKVIPKCPTKHTSLTEMFLFLHGQDKGKNASILADGNLMGANIMYSRTAINMSKFNTHLGRNGPTLLGREESEFNRQLIEKGYFMAYVPSADVDHLIQPDRFTMRYLIRLYFYEGISEYLVNKSILLRRLHKPFLGVFSLVAAFLTLNRKHIIIRFLRLIQNIGTCYGPYYSLCHTTLGYLLYSVSS
ncbi:MAG: glycosyltransferase [Negativicutes bacterium]|nr:glycosyltransferase [Negativicutes bacterium]